MPAMDIRIDPMTAADWPAVHRIYAAGIATGRRDARARGARLGSLRPLPPPRLPAASRDDSIPTRTGPRLGRALRYSARRVYTGVAWESVYVADGARGQGVGRALLEALIAASEAVGVWTLLAGVLVENAASLALHERVGFRRVGVNERIGQDVDRSLAGRRPASNGGADGRSLRGLPARTERSVAASRHSG